MEPFFTREEFGKYSLTPSLEELINEDITQYKSRTQIVREEVANSSNDSQHVLGIQPNPNLGGVKSKQTMPSENIDSRTKSKVRILEKLPMEPANVLPISKTIHNETRLDLIVAQGLEEPEVQPHSSAKMWQDCILQPKNNSSEETFDDLLQTFAQGKKKSKKEPYSAYLIPPERYPRYSRLSKAEQSSYLELYQKYVINQHQPQNREENKEVHLFKELQCQVNAEQDAFMKYLENSAMKWPEVYHNTRREVQKYIDIANEDRLQRVKRYPQFYVNQDTVAIAAPKVFSPVPFYHIKTLLNIGTVPALKKKITDESKKRCLYMEYENINRNVPADSNKTFKKKVVSEDEICSELSATHHANIVISSSALSCLVNNHPPFTRSWEIPVEVREIEAKGNDGKIQRRKVVFIDKPFIPKQRTLREQTTWYCKFALKSRYIYPILFRAHFKKSDINPLSFENIQKKEARTHQGNVNDDSASESSEDDVSFETQTQDESEKPGKKSRWNPSHAYDVNIEDLETFGTSYSSKSALSFCTSKKTNTVSSPKKNKKQEAETKTQSEEQVIKEIRERTEDTTTDETVDLQTRDDNHDKQADSDDTFKKPNIISTNQSQSYAQKSPTRSTSENILDLSQTISDSDAEGLMIDCESDNEKTLSDTNQLRSKDKDTAESEAKKARDSSQVSKISGIQEFGTLQKTELLSSTQNDGRIRQENSENETELPQVDGPPDTRRRSSRLRRSQGSSIDSQESPQNDVTSADNVSRPGSPGRSQTPKEKSKGKVTRSKKTPTPYTRRKSKRLSKTQEPIDVDKEDIADMEVKQELLLGTTLNDEEKEIILHVDIKNEVTDPDLTNEMDLHPQASMTSVHAVTEEDDSKPDSLDANEDDNEWAISSGDDENQNKDNEDSGSDVETRKKRWRRKPRRLVVSDDEDETEPKRRKPAKPPPKPTKSKQATNWSVIKRGETHAKPAIKTKTHDTKSAMMEPLPEALLKPPVKRTITGSKYPVPRKPNIPTSSISFSTAKNTQHGRSKSPAEMLVLREIPEIKDSLHKLPLPVLNPVTQVKIPELDTEHLKSHTIKPVEMPKLNKIVDTPKEKPEGHDPRAKARRTSRLIHKEDTTSQPSTITPSSQKVVRDDDLHTKAVNSKHVKQVTADKLISTPESPVKTPLSPPHTTDALEIATPMSPPHTGSVHHETPMLLRGPKIIPLEKEPAATKEGDSKETQAETAVHSTSESFLDRNKLAKPTRQRPRAVSKRTNPKKSCDVLVDILGPCSKKSEAVSQSVDKHVITDQAPIHKTADPTENAAHVISNRQQYEESKQGENGAPNGKTNVSIVPKDPEASVLNTIADSTTRRVNLEKEATVENISQPGTSSQADSKLNQSHMKHTVPSSHGVFQPSLRTHEQRSQIKHPPPTLHLYHAPPNIRDPKEWVMYENASNFKKPNTDNATYNLWQVGKQRVLIRCGIHAFNKKDKFSNDFHFVHLQPKLEYQRKFGFEQVTLEEISTAWINLAIRNNCKLERVHIEMHPDVKKPWVEILKNEEIDLLQLLQTSPMFNPDANIRVLSGVFDKLGTLPVGHYLLSHAPGNAQAHIKKTTKSKSGVYDLRLAYEHTSLETTSVPWVPIDYRILLPFHRQHQRIPCTFEPRDSSYAQVTTYYEHFPKGSKNKKKKKKGGGTGKQSKS